MRKVDDGEKKRKKRKKKIMTFIVATNVVASQPPESRPSETPTTHSNNLCDLNDCPNGAKPRGIWPCIYLLIFIHDSLITKNIKRKENIMF